MRDRPKKDMGRNPSAARQKNDLFFFQAYGKHGVRSYLKRLKGEHGFCFQDRVDFEQMVRH